MSSRKLGCAAGSRPCTVLHRDGSRVCFLLPTYWKQACPISVPFFVPGNGSSVLEGAVMAIRTGTGERVKQRTLSQVLLARRSAVFVPAPPPVQDVDRELNER